MVSITANVTATLGITKVEYYIDGVLVGAANSGPYTYNWQATLGQHTLVAKAYDAAGNVGTSAPVAITVPAKVTVTNPVDGNTVNGVISNFTATFSHPAG